MSDEWYTPPHVFEALGERFDLDVAAPVNGVPWVPAGTWIYMDSLTLPWHGFVWCNPSFGGRNALQSWFRNAWSRADAVLFTPKLHFVRPDGTAGQQPANGTALWAAGKRAVRARDAGLGVMGTPVRPQVKVI